MWITWPTQGHATVAIIRIITRSSVNAEESAAVAKILKENPKYMWASLTQGHAHFSSECGFMVGLGKPNKTIFYISFMLCCASGFTADHCRSLMLSLVFFSFCRAYDEMSYSMQSVITSSGTFMLFILRELIKWSSINVIKLISWLYICYLFYFIFESLAKRNFDKNAIKRNFIVLMRYLSRFISLLTQHTRV